jgi:FkbM family methyltransferase
MHPALLRVRRTLRHHPAAERLVSAVRAGREIRLPEVGMSIPVAPGDAVLDCGANVGDIASRFARCGAAVYAFEPNPRAFRVLARRFRGMPNVRCHMMGVMDAPGELALRVPLAHGRWDDLDATVSGSFVSRGEPDVPYETVRVPCIDLAAFVVALGARVRLAKIDIEGAEIGVVNRLIDSGVIDRIDHLVVETHERQQPALAEPTAALRRRIEREGLAGKVRLDWI